MLSLSSQNGKKEVPGNQTLFYCYPDLLLGKIFGTDFNQSVGEYLEKNALLGRSQHDSVKNKSCQTNLIFFFDSVTSLVHHKNVVDTAYFDFSKAFNKVSHYILGREDGEICA